MASLVQNSKKRSVRRGGKCDIAMLKLAQNGEDCAAAIPAGKTVNPG